MAYILDRTRIHGAKTSTGVYNDKGEFATFVFNPKTKKYEATDPDSGDVLSMDDVMKYSYNTGYAPMICPPGVANNDPNNKYSQLNLSLMNVGGKIESSENVDNLNGKNAGSWAVNPHMTDDELKEWKKTSPEAYTENMANVKMYWNSVSGSSREHGVAVVGKAGWGKSEIMTSVARASGYDVIIVNLSMAASEDVLGIPVPDRMASGQLKTEYAAPGWLAYVAQHPDDKICIFFDEFNQASMDVLGTIQNFLLTRTINGVEYKNIKFMAAGNEKSENRSLVRMEDLNAIHQRFKVWHWVTDWNYYFDWHRKTFENKFGKPLMDEFDANKESFASPRNLTIHIFDWIENAINHLKKDPTDVSIYTGDRILTMFYDNSIAKWNEDEHKFEQISDSQAKNLADLADYVAKYIYDAATGGSTNTGSGHTFGSKNRTTMEKLDVQRLRDMMQDGFVLGEDGNTYGICKENIMYVFDESIYPAEVVERTVETLEKVEGIKWKYTTKKQCKAGCKKEGIADNIEVDLDQFVADDKGNVTKK